jgi:general secretion pathway protein J
MNKRSRQLNAAGFTLVEVLVATSIASFVMVIAMGTLHALSESASRIQTHCDTASELRYAASVVSRDLACLCADQDAQNRKLLYQDASDMGVSMLTFYTVSHNQVRAAQAEADVYEVEYYLSQTEERSMLMRRVWPHPVKDEEPGGVLSVLAEGIGVFLVRFYDGQQWVSEWTEEQQQQLPQLIEVALATRPEAGGSPFSTSFLIRPVTAQAQGMDMEQMEGANSGESISNVDTLNGEG